MKKFIIRMAINAIAFFVALTIMSNYGITPQSEDWYSYLLLGLIFGAINATVRPLMMFLTCPLIVLTLGLGTLLVNTLMFYLVGLAGSYFKAGFSVEGFWPAFFGALIVSVVSVVLSVFLKDEMEGRRKSKKRH